MTAPHVYVAITAVTEALSKGGIQKSRTNEQERYQFRGIDEVYNRLSPLLAEHRLCILPRILKRDCGKRRAANGTSLVSVCLRVAYDLVSAQDGSVHSIETFGEALDAGDKATSKAMSAAFKSAILQAFCVPVTGRDDADAETYRLRSGHAVGEPAQGWEQWAEDIIDLVRVCQTNEALDRVQSTHRNMLKAISTERRALYERIGQAVGAQRIDLKPKPPKRKPRTSVRRRVPAGGNGEIREHSDVQSLSA